MRGGGVGALAASAVVASRRRGVAWPRESGLRRALRSKSRQEAATLRCKALVGEAQQAGVN